MHVEIHADDAWAASVADRWSELLSANPTASMCLPTGATPRAVYGEMAERVASGRTSFQQATVFVLDEFMGLDVGDPARCDSMIHADLTSRVELPSTSRFGPDPAAGDPAAEIEAYAELVRESRPSLTMLGVGGNGHIALNEPGSAVDSRARIVTLAPTTVSGALGYGARSIPTGGMTLGIADLLAAEEVWLLAAGSHKAKIVQRALTGPVDSSCPASYLQEADHAVAWLDESAAGLL